MKKIFSMIGALLAGAAMFSCTAPEETQPALGTTITVTPETVEVAGQDAEEITLQVACDGVWLAQTESWITVEPMTGEGNATVTVKVANNMDPEAPEELDAPRKGVITFAVGKENVVKVNVAQAGDPEKAAKKLPYSETFENGQGRFKLEDVVLPEGSTYVWKHDSYDGVAYMKASGYVGSKKVSDSYLVSPVLDLTSESNAAVTFEHTGKYFGDMTKEAQLWVREEGADKWGKQLEITGWMVGSDYVFVNSGVISLKEYVGKKIQLGWRYQSSADAAGTWEVNNIKVYNPDTTTETPEEPETPADPETPEEPETPAVPTVANIDAIEELGTYNITTATVVAVEYKNMVVKGENRLMYVKSLSNAAANYAIGDVISLTKATVKESYGVTVIDGAAALTIEKTGTATVDHGTPVAVDAAWIEGFVTALTPEYVTFSGEGAASGSAYSLNVAVEGSDINMSITLPTAEEVTALVGKTVTVKGYSFDYNSSKKYISIMKVELTEAE